MKGKIMFLMIVLSFVLTINFVAANGQGQGTNRVHGFVYCKDPGQGNHIENAAVNVTCYHNSTITKQSTLSGDGGHYDSFFDVFYCLYEDNVLVEASKDGNSGSNTGTMGQNNVNINVDVCEDEDIPEFSAITAGIALVGAFAGFAALRKRK